MIRTTALGGLASGILLAAAGACSNGTLTSTHAAESSVQAPAEPDLSQGIATFDSSIPAQIEVKRAPTGHLLVKPSINGVQTGWFIFDTGAGICVVSTPHVDAFALKEVGNIGAVGVGGSESKKLYRASALTLGSLRLADHPIMTTDLSFLKEHLHDEIVGVIGYGVLSTCVAEIEIGDAQRPPRIALFDPARYTLAQGSWTPLEMIERVPAVRARFEGPGEGREGLFRIDTGANGFVTFHQPAVERWHLLEGRSLEDAKLGGVGGFVAAKKGSLAWFEIGGVRRENIPVTFAIEPKGTFSDSTKDGNIGADLLRPFRMVMDYTNSRAAFIATQAP
jgi:hypothetical protein